MSANKRRKIRDLLELEVDASPLEAVPAEDEDTWASDLPCDSLATIMLFRGMLQSVDLPTHPVVLRSHIYSVVNDRTTVDRELDQLRLTCKVQLVSTASDIGECAMMLWADYMDTINRALQCTSPVPNTPSREPHSTSTASGADRNKASVLQHFQNVVLPACRDVMITRTALEQLLQQSAPETRQLHPRVHQPPPSQHPRLQEVHVQQPGSSAHPTQQHTRGGSLSAGTALPAGITMEEYINTLMGAGFLCRSPVSSACVLVCAPRLGAMLQHIYSGRQELVGWLSRRKYREAAEKEVLKLKLRKSPLPVGFHVKDAVGSGVVRQLKTTSGLVYQVAAKSSGRG